MTYNVLGGTLNLALSISTVTYVTCKQPLITVSCKLCLLIYDDWDSRFKKRRHMWMYSSDAHIIIIIIKSGRHDNIIV